MGSVAAIAVCAAAEPEGNPAMPIALQFAEVPYGVPETPWEASRGHHRACIRVEEPAPAVQVLIPWRRRDHEANRRNIVVVDAATGQRLANVVRVQVEREYGILAFEPQTAPGEVHVYTLPAPAPQRQRYDYSWDYEPPEDTADPGWCERCGLTPEQVAGGSWQRLPQAHVLRLEARTEFDRFDPMEVIATAAEIRELLARFPQPYLVFPEDRRYPIRMTTDLPMRWIQAGPGAHFRGEAMRNEFYVFQLGIYAVTQPLEAVDIEFSDLRAAGSGTVLPASSLRCFNLGGVNWDGQPFRQTVTVAAGTVQALWLGLLVPAATVPGDYEGTVIVRPRNAAPTTVTLRLNVGAESRPDHGDDELWRHARLRWLDSTLGTDDGIVGPYTPLEVDGHTVRCLGRQVHFAANGLFDSIRSGDQEILEQPLAWVIETEAGPLALTAAGLSIGQPGPGAVEWHAESAGEVVGWRCHGRMECDGHTRFQLTLRALQAIQVKDLRLEIPVRRAAATYLMGIGRMGGYRPPEYTWRWEGPYDSFWLGDVPAGLHCELRGGNYHGPLLSQFHPPPPPTWSNGGQGGCTIRDRGENCVLAQAFSGPRELAAGQELTFEWALLITPVKPLDSAAHFRQRYHHSIDIDQRVLDARPTVINVHHANAVNPYINYPFIAVERMREFVRTWQDHGMKVKIYYTVRELSNYAAEMWALRSLGHEIFAGGGGGGHTWLREHLVTDYAPWWFTFLEDGTSDASIGISGASRWYNYYVEGLAWLLQNVGIDGLYLDDVAYDRVTLKRMRKVMDRNRPGCLLDLHSNTAFSHGPANQYAEFFPYIDSVWFGEGFRFNEMSPDQWLVEASGIPFGLMGEVLAQYGYSPWQGMIYGMSCRGVNPLWTLWDQFGIADAEMIGYWAPHCPIRTSHPQVLATVYRKPNQILVAVASWAPELVTVRLIPDWNRLGWDPIQARLSLPAVEGMQQARNLNLADGIPLKPLEGALLWLDRPPQP
jgi:hypothetical protein